jgi:hypothetical protein
MKKPPLPKWSATFVLRFRKRKSVTALLRLLVRLAPSFVSKPCKEEELLAYAGYSPEDGSFKYPKGFDPRLELLGLPFEEGTMTSMARSSSRRTPSPSTLLSGWLFA